jgi:hypothetical protein
MFCWVAAPIEQPNDLVVLVEHDKHRGGRRRQVLIDPLEHAKCLPSIMTSNIFQSAMMASPILLLLLLLFRSVRGESSGHNNEGGSRMDFSHPMIQYRVFR